MIIDETLPTDDVLVSDLPYYIRQTREALNAAGAFNFSEQVALLESMPSVSSAGVNVIFLSAPYDLDITDIDGGQNGDIVIIYFVTSNITLIHDLAGLSMRGDPYNQDFPAAISDVIAFVKATDAWHEIFRALALTP